ncbi:MAG: CPBP family intramembrane metalloprotease [Chloroflexaceae bacterium]|nr:CPBP family intramembrane metalloprotease [Chloroflexaceae bacterium]
MAASKRSFFRGLIQSAAQMVMGRQALVYGALVFAVLHIGYFSVPAVLFAFLLGLLFAYIVALSGSLLGVALLHSSINVVQILVVPLIVQPVTAFQNLLPGATPTETITTSIVLLILAGMTFIAGWVLLLLGYLAGRA